MSISGSREGSENKKYAEKMRDFKASDLILTGGELQFAGGDDGDEQHTPVELVVRTNSSVETWFGNMIHDLHGMFCKEKIPLDWSHGGESNEILGFLDKIVKSNEEIRCSGQVISIEPGDIASRVVKQMKAGIPFESSIYFGGQGLVMEEVNEEASATVNGGKFEGPGIIVRKWPLRGVAICPHGADNSTSTSLALSEEKVSVLVLTNKEATMANSDVDSDVEAKEKKEEMIKFKEALREEIEKELEKEHEEKLADCKLVSPDGVPAIKFKEAFGNDGSNWFVEGKTFSEASTLYTQKLEERVKVLEKRLKAAAIGDDDSVDFQDNDVEDAAIKEKAESLVPKIGPALARFAAGLKIRQ